MGERDARADALRLRYRKKFDALEERIESARARLDREREQAKRARAETRSKVGSAILDAMFGRTRSAVRAGSSSAKKAREAREQTEDVHQAEAKLEGYEADMRALEAEFRSALQDLDARLDGSSLNLTPVEIAPRRRDVTVQDAVLVWIPIRNLADGSTQLACDLR